MVAYQGTSFGVLEYLYSASQEETLSAFEEGTMLLAEETVRDRQRAFEKGYDALTTGVSHLLCF